MTKAASERPLPSTPLPANETERLAALQRYNVLDTPPEAAFDRITRLAARLFKMPIALISLVDESRAWFKSCVGFGANEVPRDATLCSFAVLTDEPLVIPDTRLDDRFVCNSFVQSEPGVRFYAGAPLLTQDGFNLGTLCLLDTEPRDALTDEQKATLVDLAAMVVDELELRLAARKNAQVEAALLEVTRGVSAVTGHAFFSALVQHLTKALGMNYACISLLVNEQPAALKTIAFCAQGEIIDDVEYLLQDTPCLEVIRQHSFCCYPQGIQASFPNNDFLAEFGIESYAAVPFSDSTGKLLGLLSVMDSKPLENAQLVRSLLTIFAMRIAAELERQQAAERLQIYADVVRNAQVGVVVWQLEDLNNPGSFRLLIANAAASRATGFDFEPLIGMTMAECFPMLLQMPLVHQYVEVVRTQQALDLGEVPYSEDGIIAGVYSLKAFPLPNDCLGLAFENITVRKQIETQLQESQRYSQQIAETMPGVLFVYDLIEQRTVYTNRQIADFLGYTSEQVQAMGADALPTLIHPDDLQRMFQYLQDFGSAAEGTVLAIEYQARHANGEWRWLYSQSVVFKRTIAGLAHQILGVSIDVTDRKHVEQEREQFLKAGSDLQVIAGNNGYFQWVSPSFEHILGWTPAEMTARPWTEFVHPDDIDPSITETSSLFSGNETFKFENRYRHKDGTDRWLLWNAQPSLEKQVLYGTAIDISDRKQAEEAARQSEEQTRLAIQVAQLGTWRYDLSTGLVELDERMCQMWGKLEDVATIPLPQVIEQIHPDDRARVEHHVAAALDPKSLGTYEIEYRIVWDDGSERWIAANGQAQFEGEGASRRAIQLIGTAVDITERVRVEDERKQAEAILHESEERLRTLTATIPQLIWTTLPDGSVDYLSEQWTSYVGLPPERLYDYNWRQVVHPEDLPSTLRDWEHSLQSGEPLEIQHRFRYHTGEWRWQLVRGIPIKNGVGQITRWVGTCTDIQNEVDIKTALQASYEAEQQARSTAEAAREEAQAANRVKDEFLAVLSHELRSPLNPILGWSTLLLNGKLDATKTTQALTTIQRNAKLQSELIEDLLDVSRILQGKLSLNVAPVNLASTIQAAMETVRLAAEAKSITVEVSLSPDVGLVSGDATRLQQVIWNLLSNAIKFTPQRGRVNIQLERVDSYAHITVSDTGQGIAPDFLPYVFDYFRQANAATTRRFGGLGLGLAIVRHLVELHGGTVGVESLGESQGATFTVQFPLMPIQKVSNQGNQSSELSPDLNGIQVLVVDDEPDSREFVAFVLEQAGAKVTTATTADEALRMLIQLQPDVLLSDIGMPDMDGYMLMQQVRALPSEQGGQIRAIALTAYAGEMNQQQALQAGFQQHLSKPVEPEMLVGAIASLTNHT